MCLNKNRFQKKNQLMIISLIFYHTSSQNLIHINLHIYKNWIFFLTLLNPHQKIVANLIYNRKCQLFQNISSLSCFLHFLVSNLIRLNNFNSFYSSKLPLKSSLPEYQYIILYINIIDREITVMRLLSM